MNIENRRDYIKYRIQRAEEALEEALLLAENERWNAVINRLYYAAFYAVIALLLKHNIHAKSHEGVRIQLGLNFIKPGKIDKKFGKLFTKLADFRQKGILGTFMTTELKSLNP